MTVYRFVKYALLFIVVNSPFSFGTNAGLNESPDFSGCDKASSKIFAKDDFNRGLNQWIIEQQDAHGKVSAKAGVLDIQQPAGATLWFRRKLQGNYSIEFTATPIPIKGEKGEQRISDLNMFWNATDPQSKSHNPTKLALDGALASYNPLQLYYVGFGANYNTTTRLRRYDGSEQRTQITGYATPEAATLDDRAGAMSAHARLNANEPVHVRIISRKPDEQHAENLLWYANEKLIFSLADPNPYLEGWFGFRTTFSHFQIQNFRVYQCKLESN